MNAELSAWYVRGEDNQPAGPFAAEELIEALRAGRLDRNTICWREGLSEWLPLERVEPFASAFRRARARTQRLVLVWALGGALTSLVVGVGVVGSYAYRSEAASLAEARNSFEEGRYQESMTKLRSLLETTRFHHAEAEFLLASGRLRQYAASEAEAASSDAVDEAAERFRGLFDSRPNWRERARQDLAGLMDDIPAGAPDALARSIILAEVLAELDLSDLAALPPWLRREKQFAALREQALEALDKRDFSAAVALLNGALKIKPDHEDTEQRLYEATTEVVRQRLFQAERMISRGEYAGARVILAGVQKLDADNFGASELLRRIDSLTELASLKTNATSALEGRDYDAALSLLRKAMRIAPFDDEVTNLAQKAQSGLVAEKMSLARELASGRRYAEAQTLLTDVLRIEPDNAAARGLQGQLDGLVQFGDLKQAGVAALERGEYERALALLSKASDANPHDEEVKSLARTAKTERVQKWVAEAERLMAGRKYSEAQHLLNEAMAVNPGNPDLSNLAKRIATLQNNPETTDLTGVWVAESNQNKFQFTVEGNQVRIEGIPSAGMALSNGRRVRALIGHWQRQGSTLGGDVMVGFTDGASAVFEVSATVVSPTILRVRWNDARWDPIRKKWIGWGYTDWHKDRGETTPVGPAAGNLPTDLDAFAPGRWPNLESPVEVTRPWPDEPRGRRPR